MTSDTPNAPAPPIKRLSLSNDNFIFDDRRRFIFAFVPKVACTNWKAILRHMAGHHDYLNNRLAHDRKSSGLHYLDLTGPESALLDDPKVPRYSFVRDPYARALSAYLNKIESRIPRLGSSDTSDHFLKVTREIDAFRRDRLGQDSYPAIDFEVFLLFLTFSGSPFRRDEHWQSQTSLLAWPHVRFDFIGRFENLVADSSEILRRMGCDVPFPTQKQVSFPATGAVDLLTSYLTPACAQLIEQLYPADFDNFAYQRRH